MRRKQTKRVAIRIKKARKVTLGAFGDYGGGSGIRTLDTLSRMLVFKTSAFNRSANPPCNFRFNSAPGRACPLQGDENIAIRMVYCVK